jgi:hypothetical protein
MHMARSSCRSTKTGTEGWTFSPDWTIFVGEADGRGGDLRLLSTPREEE